MVHKNLFLVSFIIVAQKALTTIARNINAPQNKNDLRKAKKVWCSYCTKIEMLYNFSPRMRKKFNDS